ncbi:MAG: hypothetical protein AUJ98_11645 [Bacteroidetes bacterium CG2_30_33_31]|nr:MAG: hypothetical protein AUJ98_11645 [Bacteroidetes bacterium CG2_30_33_31]
MKKLILFLSFIYLGSLVVFAQSLSLRNLAGAVNNGDTITYVSTDNNVIFSSFIWIKNNSAQPISVRVKKIELNVLSGTENYFCWTSCYLPSQFIGDTLRLNAGQTNKTNFSGDYGAQGVSGKSQIMYVFYDDANHNDSVAFVAEYYAGSGVGIANSDMQKTFANLYPSPAKNSVTLDYYLTKYSDAATFELRNILGSIVKSFKLNNSAGKMKFDVGDLQNGIYFYTIKVDDKVLVSHKMVVQK